jgi:hypothetical protein
MKGGDAQLNAMRAGNVTTSAVTKVTMPTRKRPRVRWIKELAPASATRLCARGQLVIWRIDFLPEHALHADH